MTKFIGAVCFNCKTWLPSDKDDNMFCPTELYQINVILFCSFCNPEYIDEMINEQLDK